MSWTCQEPLLPFGQDAEKRSDVGPGLEFVGAEVVDEHVGVAGFALVTGGAFRAGLPLGTLRALHAGFWRRH
jgi:hypothetical protein